MRVRAGASVGGLSDRREPASSGWQGKQAKRRGTGSADAGRTGRRCRLLVHRNGELDQSSRDDKLKNWRKRQDHVCRERRCQSEVLHRLVVAGSNLATVVAVVVDGTVGEFGRRVGKLRAGVASSAIPELVARLAQMELRENDQPSQKQVDPPHERDSTLSGKSVKLWPQ